MKSNTGSTVCMSCSTRKRRQFQVLALRNRKFRVFCVPLEAGHPALKGEKYIHYIFFSTNLLTSVTDAQRYFLLSKCAAKSLSIMRNNVRLNKLFSCILTSGRFADKWQICFWIFPSLWVAITYSVNSCSFPSYEWLAILWLELIAFGFSFV